MLICYISNGMCINYSMNWVIDGKTRKREKERKSHSIDEWKSEFIYGHFETVDEFKYFENSYIETICASYWLLLFSLLNFIELLTRMFSVKTFHKWIFFCINKIELNYFFFINIFNWRERAIWSIGRRIYVLQIKNLHWKRDTIDNCLRLIEYHISMIEFSE